MLQRRINTYLGVLCITVVGAAAAFLIMKISALQSFDGSNPDLNGALANLNMQAPRAAPGGLH